jgi:diaminopimelate decarboxylase
LLAKLGAGADVVSEGELRQALAAGVPPERIVFSGIGKTESELAFALARGIFQINVESVGELDLLSRVAARAGVTAKIALRVNPDVDARTHAKISTGRKENKFGIDLAHAGAAYERAARLKGVKPVGLAVHIGSQLTTLAPFKTAFDRLVKLALELRRAGHAVERLDFGGGLGIRYRAETPPPISAYAALVRRSVGKHGFAIALEPGRSIVGNAGVLVTRVLYLKEGATRRFAVVDAAMNDLIRPALYDAWHEIAPVKAAKPGARRAPLDVVGPVCETGDTFALARRLPPVVGGELLAIMSAGAYGAVMSSGYNSRRLVPEVLVNGHEFAVIRPRQTFDELLARDRWPDWLSDS